MITIRREDFTREEWDAAETAVDKYPHLLPWLSGIGNRECVRQWLEAIRKEEHREANDEEYSPRKVVALMGAACTLERLLEEELITRKTVKPEGSGKRTGKGKKAA